MKLSRQVRGEKESYDQYNHENPQINSIFSITLYPVDRDGCHREGRLKPYPFVGSRPAVRGHPKAASEGHFKTGHFQEP